MTMLSAFLTLTGQKQGQIKGSVTQKGREGTIEVIAVSHSILSPRDAASGLPSGKRMHKPLIITKELDMATPALLSAVTSNENISKWELNFFLTAYNDRTQSVGTEMNNYVIKLTNASICSYDFRGPNNKHPDLMKFKEYEEVAFVYEQIEWTWIKGGITSGDSWIAPAIG
jgi:type VI secretion system secreted protein Hcp